MEDYITKQCPHCNQWVYLPKQEFNCKIYRHGILKSNYTQIDPHLPKDVCDKLKQNDVRTITIETGIQNSGLALVLIFNPKVFLNKIINSSSTTAFQPSFIILCIASFQYLFL